MKWTATGPWGEEVGTKRTPPNTHRQSCCMEQTQKMTHEGEDEEKLGPRAQLAGVRWGSRCGKSEGSLKVKHRLIT